MQNSKHLTIARSDDSVTAGSIRSVLDEAGVHVPGSEVISTLHAGSGDLSYSTDVREDDCARAVEVPSSSGLRKWLVS